MRDDFAGILNRIFRVQILQAEKLHVVQRAVDSVLHDDAAVFDPNAENMGERMVGLIFENSVVQGDPNAVFHRDHTRGTLFAVASAGDDPAAGDPDAVVIFVDERCVVKVNGHGSVDGRVVIVARLKAAGEIVVEHDFRGDARCRADRDVAVDGDIEIFRRQRAAEEVAVDGEVAGEERPDGGAPVRKAAADGVRAARRDV